jgi:hypothetical protein
MINIKKPLFFFIWMVFAAQVLSAAGTSGTNAALADIPLIHGVRWDMGARSIRAAEKNGTLIDDFEMDNETTVSFRSFFEEEGSSNRWPVNISYFLFNGKLYSILCNYLSTNEASVISNFHEAIDHFGKIYGKPKLTDNFRNITAWETNGTVLSIILGPSAMVSRKTMFSIQFDSPDAQDIRLKLDRIRSDQFKEKENLTNE